MEKGRDLLSAELLAFIKSGRPDYTRFSFETFWRDVENPLFRAECILALVRHAAESGRWGRFSGISTESAIATLSLIVLSSPQRADNPDYLRIIEEARRRWTAGHVAAYTTADKCISSILAVAAGDESRKTVQQLAEIVCTSSPLIRKDLRLVWSEARLSSLGSHFGWEGPHLSHNNCFSAVETGVSSLFPSYIRSKLQLSAYNSNDVLEVYYPLLSSALITPDSPLSLPHILHSLESALATFPTYSTDILEQIAVALDLARRQPLPQARAAQRILQQLHWERRCPGSALLSALEENFPWILTLEKGEKFANVFILLNEEEIKDKELYIDMGRISRNELVEHFPGLNPALAHAEDGELLSFISHMLRIHALSFISRRLSSVGKCPSLPDLRHLSINDIYRLYQQVRSLLKAISTAKSPVADRLIAEKMTEIEEDARACEADLDAIRGNLVGICFGEGEIGTALRCPAACFAISEAYIGPGDKELRESAAASHFSSLLSSVSTRKNPSNGDYNHKVKLVLAGNDRLFHSFLCSFVHRYQQSPDDLPIRLYVVPDCEDKSSLSAYIASIDTWYNRYLYTPFAKRPFAPRLSLYSEETQQKRKGTTELTSGFTPLQHHSTVQNDLKPTIALHSLLQDYIHEGRSTALIKVLQVRCWRRDNSEEDPDLILPLGLYLEVGFPAAAMRAKQDNTAQFGDFTIEEVMAKRLFPYNPPSILISAVQIDLMGNLSEKTEEALKEVQSLTISNIPRAGDYWAAAHPSSPSFELAFLESRSSGEAAALEKKLTKRGKTKLCDYEICMKALYTNLHVAKVKLTGSRNEGFDVRADGVLYGPFSVVEVQSWRTGKGLLTLPVATFLDTY